VGKNESALHAWQKSGIGCDAMAGDPKKREDERGDGVVLRCGRNSFLTNWELNGFISPLEGGSIGFFTPSKQRKRRKLSRARSAGADAGGTSSDFGDFRACLLGAGS